MPLFEKPLSELKLYRGINPRPADFDAYWDSSLQEMRSIDPKVDLRPSTAISSRIAECFDLWYTGVLIKSTLDHKFLCFDEKYHTARNHGRGTRTRQEG